MKSVKALLLAAGLGTRLRPITNEIPKCLVKVGGMPVLQRWLDDLLNAGCLDVTVNTHYHAEKVDDYLRSCKSNKINIRTEYEKTLLGTAGTLLNHKSTFESGITILVHADNATDFVVGRLLEAHNKRPEYCVATMLTFKTDAPEKCGIVGLNEEGVVTSFFEKQSDYHGTTANGAVYLLEPEVFEIIEVSKTDVYDFSLDVLPLLIGKIFTYHTPLPYIDIGTPENLAKAQMIWTKQNE